MSEYQYYEFQAIDYPLDQTAMDELRSLSSRADISPTRFVNTYNFGDFRGKPETLMERYFDAFVYVANWGSHWCMLRLPKRLLDPKLVERYAGEDGFTMRESGDWVILEMRSESEGDGGYGGGGPEWMPPMVALRGELAGGDLRALYLGWLFCVQDELLLPEEVEPPVPPGLGTPSAALGSLADFLRLDEDLLAVAAERSAKAGAASGTPKSDAAMAEWIRALPSAEKDDALIRLLRDGELHLRAELSRRFREAQGPASPALAEGGRTGEQLLAAAEERRAARKRVETARLAEERARRDREQAANRAAHLAELEGREPELWRRTESLVETKLPAEYDRAIQTLVDLRDLAARTGTTDGFAARLRELRARHARKTSFIQKLDRAKLG